eukprot:CAMPEP_0181109112 /NCGR_PEP_ID=MMETSP1071-20121207/18000_1 /TAXON_ID=35127 /ORGANISM="Thalassiosira sp., Strain NH16" /LENGTH=684 /DNA_ID=CAMNT_0023192781 /DNA_START=140 /DNA_END=2195 /DNA_ORIENTATION=-
MSTAPTSKPSSRRAKDIFGDCALVEIIHLHDCFRGALKNLEVDVCELCREITAAAGGGAVRNNNPEGRIIDLERRVAGRFTVIWSVFRAHSAAEDEFIWPALKAKQVAIPEDGCNCNDSPVDISLSQEHQPSGQPNALQGGGEAVSADNDQQQRDRAQSLSVQVIEQEEYEEDHADEERMFNSISELLSSLRGELSSRCKTSKPMPLGCGESNNATNIGSTLDHTAQMLLEGTRKLMTHLLTHLDKEETHCMPLVAQYLTKAEINDLVGKIMGKRSSELMSQILTMAVQNLNEADRDDMVRYMKQAMVGTFFERWLKMGGWAEKTAVKHEDCDDGGGKMPKEEEQEMKMSSTTPPSIKESESEAKPAASKDSPKEANDELHHSSVPEYAVASASVSAVSSYADDETTDKYTSPVELEKLIRAIGTNPHLDAKQKNLTIQGLRDSVWKSNCRLSKRKREEGTDLTAMEQPAAQVARMTTAPVAAAAAGASSAQVIPGGHPSQSHHMSFSVSSGGATRFKRETPPSSYFKKINGEVKLVWSSDPHSTQLHPNDGTVPLFSASELAPTYHDGGINHVLGCPHYARSCKLRHPSSGRLYTCRLCCEQTREMAPEDKDSPLDRFAVKEILCMICGALQPAGDKCVNPSANQQGNPLLGTHAPYATSTMIPPTNLSTIAHSAMFADQGKA